jgi:indolepyruvate ferredoxin oxidoreductase alpha subunit
MMESIQTNITGIDAAYMALKDGGVRVVTGVPGYPINDLFTRFQKDESLNAEWAFNEKIAYEMAVGASVCGERAVVVSKHVGINILSDPLIISVTHGIGAGIVVIAGDDVGAFMSSDEQDSRWYGKLAEIPVFDPSSPAEVYDSIVGGFELSERISAPVIVRMVDIVLREHGDVARKTLPSTHKKLDKSVWDYTMFGKHQKYLLDGWSQAARAAERSPMNRSSKKGTVGIISSGFVSNIAARIAEEKGLSHLALGFVNPLPGGLIDDFLVGLEYVLVCEEVSPFIEEQVRMPKVRGRMTGHLPRAGPLDEASLRGALDNITTPGGIMDVRLETLSGRGYAMGKCDNCPYTPVYDAIKMLGVPVAGDAGCSIMTANPPYSMLNVALALGSAASAASGFNRKGIAMMGDYAFLHTGLLAMLNAKYAKHVGKEVVVVLFVNREAAMTGGQALPDVTGLVKDIFKEDCVINDAGELSAENVRDDLKKLLDAQGLKVYIVGASCPAGHKHRNIKI